MRRALLDDVQQADARWQAERRPTDTHGWLWERVLREVADVCVFQIGSPHYPLAALFAVRSKHVTLPAGAMRRLEYFQICPRLRGKPFGRLALAIVGRFAIDAGAVGLLMGSLPAPRLVTWYVSAGGAAAVPAGWVPPKDLVAIWFDAAKLVRLAGFADAFEE